MSAAHTIESKTILGTVSGTVLTVVVNINSSDIIKTVVLAALGAVVSFVVTVALKRVLSHVTSFKKRRRRGR
jgi:mannitol-specific phosphotransferase system IIBC component